MPVFRQVGRRPLHEERVLKARVSAVTDLQDVDIYIFITCLSNMFPDSGQVRQVIQGNIEQDISIKIRINTFQKKKSKFEKQKYYKIFQNFQKSSA